eukprot:3963917-Karenia_brevis.AAC.1
MRCKGNSCCSMRQASISTRQSQLARRVGSGSVWRQCLVRCLERERERADAACGQAHRLKEHSS